MLDAEGKMDIAQLRRIESFQGVFKDFAMNARWADKLIASPGVVISCIKNRAGNRSLSRNPRKMFVHPFACTNNLQNSEGELRSDP